MLNLPEVNRGTIISSINADKPLVVCLCAQWCNNCEDWKKEFQLLSEERGDSCFVWLDIDEHPDMVAEVDLDTLPVLAIYKNEDIAFLGPVRPDKTTIETLINGARAHPSFDDPGILEFLTE